MSSCVFIKTLLLFLFFFFLLAIIPGTFDKESKHGGVQSVLQDPGKSPMGFDWDADSCE